MLSFAGIQHKLMQKSEHITPEALGAIQNLLIEYKVLALQYVSELLTDALRSDLSGHQVEVS